MLQGFKTFKKILQVYYFQFTLSSSLFNVITNITDIDTIIVAVLAVGKPIIVSYKFWKKLNLNEPVNLNIWFYDNFIKLHRED